MEEQRSYSDADRQLQAFVQLLDASEGSRASITLLVGGAIVSGMAIGVVEYLKKYYYRMFEALNVQNRDELTEQIVAHAEEHRQKAAEWLVKEPAERNEEEELKHLPEGLKHLPNYIHLEHASVYQAGRPHLAVANPLEFSELLRIRLDSVDGFSIGVFGLSE